MPAEMLDEAERTRFNEHENKATVGEIGRL